MPCEWDGSKQPGDSTCVPDVTIVAECFEIDVTDAIETYWYKITNNEEGPVTVKLNGGADIVAHPRRQLRPSRRQRGHGHMEWQDRHRCGPAR